MYIQTKQQILIQLKEEEAIGKRDILGMQSMQNINNNNYERK